MVINKIFITGFLCGTMLVTACSQMPTSGPTEPQISESAEKNNPIGFRIVDVTPGVVDILATEREHPLTIKLEGARTAQVDQIGVGDQLSVYIFEIGSGIFSEHLGDQSSSFGTPLGAVDRSLPKLLVDASGCITVPYAGRVRAAGLTPSQLEAEIESRIKKTSQHPQVIVEIATNVANSVVVSGEVRNPGRHGLTLAHETLLDMIALSGGPAHEAFDTVVKVTGPNHSAVMPLTRIDISGRENLVLDPGDRIELRYEPRTFTVFAAAGRVSELNFGSPRLSLAEGMARAGGPNDALADPRAVYVIRFESPDVAAKLGLAGVGAPVVYHLDLIETTSYFEMARFPLRDKDVLLVANSRINQFEKVMAILTGLITPVLVGKTLSE